MRKNKGFSIIEALIYMGLVAFMIAIAGVWQKQIKNIRALKETKEKVALIQDALRRNFFSNLQYAENNCYGWGDTACSILTLTPIVTNLNTIQFNTYDTTIYNSFAQAGCILNGTVPNFTVQCYDGFGRLLTFQDSFPHNFGTDYTDYYQGNRYSLQITDSIGSTYILDINKELDWADSKTLEKVSEIGTAVKNYVRTRRISELSNVCDTGTGASNPAGGLNSSDDALVPWIWQALGNSPLTLCSGIDNTTTNCGCSAFNNSNIWQTSNSFCVIDTPFEINRFLTNLNLGRTYRVDGFGNRIQIVPLSDANGNAVNCPPPRPRPFYPVTGVPKTRVGVYNGTNWVFYIDVIGE